MLNIIHKNPGQNGCKKLKVRYMICLCADQKVRGIFLVQYGYNTGIFRQSMGARNRLGIELSYRLLKSFKIWALYITKFGNGQMRKYVYSRI